MMPDLVRDKFRTELAYLCMTNLKLFTLSPWHTRVKKKVLRHDVKNPLKPWMPPHASNTCKNPDGVLSCKQHATFTWHWPWSPAKTIHFSLWHNIAHKIFLVQWLIGALAVPPILLDVCGLPVNRKVCSTRNLALGAMLRSRTLNQGFNNLNSSWHWILSCRQQLEERA